MKNLSSFFKQMILVCGMFVVFSACKSIGKFVPDPIAPELPKYSESGYDVAGALVNGKLWKAVKSCGGIFDPCSQILTFYENTSTSRFFMGIDGDIYENDKVVGSGYMQFSFKENLNFSTLNNQIITLDGEENYGIFQGTIDGEYKSCIGGKGQIHFRKVQSTTQNGNTTTLLAGTFGFTIDTPECGKIMITYGRFDYDTFY